MKLTAGNFDQEIKRASRHFSDVQKKQIPQATAWALTGVAKKVKEAERDEMQKVFDKPTRWTLNSIFFKGATKRRLEARVWLKDRGSAGKGNAAADYLLPHIIGGQRQQKRFEGRMRHRGHIDAGEYLIPGKGTRLNQAGNMSQGRVVKMMSALGAHTEVGFTANSRDKQKQDHFVGKINGQWGVWQRVGRKGRKLKPIMILVQSARYRGRFKWYDVARRVYSAEFMGEFNRSFERAMKTAK